ncbi:dihydroorotate dehydrogenase electron transfer subunit [Candidatus Woesearchaeota archaeon]|nr:dihydroorotate dehydrogenase electron transfer subunit [Candidatus Woesearchaeota archaeon]
MDRNNQYVHTKIEKIIEHNESTRSFVLEDMFTSEPGQFGMVWLPGVDEKPISLSARNRITVRKVGPFTEKLFEKKEGQYLDVRGPYGRGFPQMGFSTLIGGGCGIPPLVYLFSKSGTPAQSFVLAGKNKDELLFLDEIIKIAEQSTHYQGHNIVAVTDDGSYGKKGFAADANIPEGSIYNLCGPEIMMKTVAEKLTAPVKEGGYETDPSKIYLSMERYMKCAVGICGSCSFSGKRVCADGPVFQYDEISSLPHFNEFARSRTGEITELKELRK